jgi:hypothetical protein
MAKTSILQIDCRHKGVINVTFTCDSGRVNYLNIYVGIHPTFGEAGRWTTSTSRGMS